MTEQAPTSLSSALFKCMEKVGESPQMIEHLLIEDKSDGQVHLLKTPAEITLKLDEDQHYEEDESKWPEFTAWTKDYIYFLTVTTNEYVDSYYIFSIGQILRHPTDGKPGMETFPL